MIDQSELDTIGRAEDFETQVALLWERNLGISIDPRADYFQHGGDSLLGTELLLWMHEKFGVELSLLDIFRSRTIEAQARLIRYRLEGGAADDKPVTEYRFFGPENARLFGALHHPGANEGRTGVVLCYPMGQEYMRIHRTYVELSKSLAAAGLYVLRFDYFGCGDSAGETIAGNLEQWRKDIGHAIAELRDSVMIPYIYLVGARIGANLVLDVSSTCDDIDGMVLWEPILNGKDYIKTLGRAHHNLLDRNAELDGYEDRELPDCLMEFVGFPVTAELHDELTAIDLHSTPAIRNIPNVLVLANSDKPELEEYAKTRASNRVRLDYIATGESDSIWLKEDRQNKGLIPAQAVQTIVSWISGRII